MINWLKRTFWRIRRYFVGEPYMVCVCKECGYVAKWYRSNWIQRILHAVYAESKDEERSAVRFVYCIRCGHTQSITTMEMYDLINQNNIDFVDRPIRR